MSNFLSFGTLRLQYVYVFYYILIFKIHLDKKFQTHIIKT